MWWKFEWFPPTSLQWTCPCSDCSPTKAYKGCSPLVHPSYHSLDSHPILQSVNLTSFVTFYLFLTHNQFFFLCILKSEKKTCLSIKVFSTFPFTPFHAQEQNSLHFASNINSPRNTKWMSCWTKQQPNKWPWLNSGGINTQTIYGQGKIGKA